MTQQRSAAAREAWSLLAELWFGDAMGDRFHSACEAIDVSPPQLKALLSLVPGELEPMRAVADRLHCDASWVTGMVDALEQRGYVERTQHPSDRRIKVITITSLGEKAKAKAIEALHEPPPVFADALTVTELRTIRDLLRKVHAHSQD